MGGALAQAFEMLAGGDREVYFIAFTSVRFSFVSTILASGLAIPAGVALHFGSFGAKRVLVAFLNALMALPTVVVGLLVFSLISRSGPLGRLGLLYSPAAVIIGQVILSFPIITSLVLSGISKLDDRFNETLYTLGAGRLNILGATLLEARFAVLSAVLAGFGRVVGEVGVSMMLGGNIRWYTRTITTTIALESSKGLFSTALALGIILIAIALFINVILHVLARDHD